MEEDGAGEAPGSGTLAVPDAAAPQNSRPSLSTLASSIAFSLGCSVSCLEKIEEDRGISAARELAAEKERRAAEAERAAAAEERVAAAARERIAAGERMAAAARHAEIMDRLDVLAEATCRLCIVGALHASPKSLKVYQVSINFSPASNSTRSLCNNLQVYLFTIGINC